MLDQVRTVYVMLGLVRSGNVRLTQVVSIYDRLGQDRPVYVMLGHVILC
jgi:hypothetical protein